MNDEQLKKLPKWAQNYISNMEYKMLQLTEENKALLKNNSQSNTFYRLLFDIDYKKIYLPDGTHLSCKGKNTEVSMYVDIEGKIRIDIGYGAIVPQARNSIYIVSEDE